MAVYVVTGGAGFIGSNVVAALEARGDDVVVVDDLGKGEQWRNIARRRLCDLVPPRDLFAMLETMRERPAAFLHFGAISDTTETDADRVADANFRLPCRVWRWCAEHATPLVYASSAATYGDGAHGWNDDDSPEALAKLRPLNAYAWSKQLFDRWAVHRSLLGAPSPPRWAGLKFFNVYGPNENHKGGQRSVAAQMFDQIAARGSVRLFKSERPGVADGGQMRDFVWVGDCVAATLFFADAPRPSGLYNVGSGKARSFADLARAAFATLDRAPAIEYVAMPESLRDKYQYFTEANLSKLRKVGWTHQPLSLEDGVRSYYRDFLMQADPHV